MDIATISVLIAVCGCFVGLAGWLSGRDKKIANDSEWRGVVNTKLDNILSLSRELNSVVQKVEEHGEKISAIERDVKSAHNRIDEILSKI